MYIECCIIQIVLLFLIEYNIYCILSSSEITSRFLQKEREEQLRTVLSSNTVLVDLSAIPLFSTPALTCILIYHNSLKYEEADTSQNPLFSEGREEQRKGKK